MHRSLPYDQYCGPSALAALAGIAPDEAAERLVKIQRRQGRDVDYRTTACQDVAACLVKLGFAVEMYDVTTGRPMQRPDPNYRDPLVDLPEWERAAVRRRIEAEIAVQKSRGEIPPVSPLPTVGQWQRQHPAGSWMLMTAGHVLALVNGKLTGNWAGEFTTAELLLVSKVTRT